MLCLPIRKTELGPERLVQQVSRLILVTDTVQRTMENCRLELELWTVEPEHKNQGNQPQFVWPKTFTGGISPVSSHCGPLALLACHCGQCCHALQILASFFCIRAPAGDCKW